jgi:hypothetical protein
MKKPSGHQVVLFLGLAMAIGGWLVFASINPAETSPKCMPEYMKKNGSDECLKTAKSSETSIQVISAEH